MATRLHFMVATDGSRSSKDAFDLVFYDLMGPRDKISVLHLYNLQKQYLPYQLRYDYIRQEYESKLISHLPQSRWELLFLPRTPHLSTCEQIQDNSQFYRASLLVVGFVGAKGPKENPVLMGSTVDHNLQYGNTPLLVVKLRAHRSDLRNGSYNWVVLVDGSARAHRGFEFTAELMNKNKDRVTFLFAKAIGETCERTHYEHKLQQHGISGTFIEIQTSGDPGNAIVQHLNNWESEIDFVVAGIDGSGNQGRSLKVGSVALSVLRNAKTNVLIYK
jgi:nucleotide-binding universal stress UspA family protein